MSAVEQLTVLAQCMAAILLGGILGWEREAAGKWAGFRTHMLVALGVLLFVRMGQYLLVQTATDTPEGILWGRPGACRRGDRHRDRVYGRRHDHPRPRCGHYERIDDRRVAASISIAVALECYIVAGGAMVLGLIILRALNRFEKLLASDSEGECQPEK